MIMLFLAETVAALLFALILFVIIDRAGDKQKRHSNRSQYVSYKPAVYDWVKVERTYTLNEFSLSDFYGTLSG